MQRKLIIYLLYSIFCILSSVFCLLFSVFYHLHLSRILYKSAPFMQNKPNFQDVQMNVNIYYTKVYKNETALGRGQNKPNSNPNKPNFQKAKINLNFYLTRDYENKGGPPAVPKQTQNRPKQTNSNSATFGRAFFGLSAIAQMSRGCVMGE